MSEVQTTSVLSDLLDTLVRCLDAESARRLVNFRVSEKAQKRVSYLAERANEGLLTPAEASEYDAFISASNMISILKLKAQRALKPNNR